MNPLKIHKKLRDIYIQKLAEVERIDINSLPERKFTTTKLKASLQIKSSIGLIAEIKKASPSRGILREKFDVSALANEYDSLKVDAISVLTDQQFFQGNNEYIPIVKQTAACPVLRKDFIISEAQVHEAYSIGADIILLIVAILKKEELSHLLKLAKQLGLEVLVEAHTESEIKIALDAGAEIIGINNRDLNTFKVDVNNALELAPLIPGHILKIAESGYHTYTDIKNAQQAGYKAVLIGEAFMISNNIRQVYQELFKNG